MLPYFNRLLFLLLLFYGFTSKAEIKQMYNPVYVDSILKSKKDSAILSQFKSKVLVDYQKNVKAINMAQPFKVLSHTPEYFYGLLGLLVFFAFMALLFSDYFLSMKESLLSFKNYQLYLYANKFDNLIVAILLTILKVALIAFIVNYILNNHILNEQNQFNSYHFLTILLVVSIFYGVKLLLEWIVFVVTDYSKVFRIFYYKKLFIDIVVGSILTLILVIWYYNTFINLDILLIVIAILYLIIIAINFIKLVQISKIPFNVYLILYICTLKIMPLLLLAKYLWLNLN